MSKSTNKDQRGLVAIVVTVMLMMIVSLMVLGYSRLTRREQRQAFDKQLNTQAFYAAESGINDAVEALRENPNLAVTDCSPGAQAAITNLTTKPIDSTGIIKSACVLIEPSNTNIVYDSIDDVDTKVFGMKAAVPIDEALIEWEAASAASGTFNFDGCSSGFPPESKWINCDAGVIRVDLVPTGTSFARPDLINNMMSLYAYPRKSGEAGAVSSIPGTSVAGGTGRGAVVFTSCDNSLVSRKCRLSVTGLNSSEYYVRIQSYYVASSVIVSPKSGGQPVRVAGAQATIDATGRANDVVKRIQVRVPLTPAGVAYARFGLKSFDALCKRYGIVPSAVNPSDRVIVDPSVATIAPGPCGIN